MQDVDGRGFRVQCSVLMEGSLNVRRLETAFEQVVQDNEILRTTFQCLPEMTIPIQVIEDRGKFSLELENLAGMTSADQQQKLGASFLELTRKGSDLNK